RSVNGCMHCALRKCLTRDDAAGFELEGRIGLKLCLVGVVDRADNVFHQTPLDLLLISPHWPIRAGTESRLDEYGVGQELSRDSHRRTLTEDERRPSEAIRRPTSGSRPEELSEPPEDPLSDPNFRDPSCAGPSVLIENVPPLSSRALTCKQVATMNNSRTRASEGYPSSSTS